MSDMLCLSMTIQEDFIAIKHIGHSGRTFCRRSNRMSTQTVDRPNTNPTSALVASTTAPIFTLPEAPDRSIALESLRGQPVILAFYPADWSPVCGDQMALYNEVLPA